MIRRDEIVEIGVYNKPHGINGEISATLMCDTEIAPKFSCYISSIDGIFVPFFAENIRTKNSQTLLLKLEGMDNDTDLKNLVNKEIYVLKKEYDTISDEYDCDEAPVDYFVGYIITDCISNKQIGEIIDIDDSTENVLFIVEDINGNEHLIPAADELVTKIDFDNKLLFMNIPDGLIND